MAKSLIWVLGIVVIGVGAFFIVKNKDGQDMVKDDFAEVLPQGDEPSDNSRMMSFSSFVKEGGTYKCTVHQNVGDMESNGTVYMDTGNLRGEFSTIAEGKTINSTFILKDGYSYGWSSMGSIGYKVPIDENTGTVSGTAESGTYTFAYDTVGSYECNPWTADSSFFVVPSTITFVDIGASTRTAP